MRHAVYDPASYVEVDEIPITEPNGGVDPRIPVRNAMTHVPEAYLQNLEAIVAESPESVVAASSPA